MTDHDADIPIDQSSRKAKPVIDKPSLTEGMTEDEIESIERDEQPIKPKRKLAPEDEIPADALGAPGRFGWRVPAVAGVISIVIAVILAGVYHTASTPWWRAALHQLVDAPLYAWIGVGAVLAAARVLERPFGGIQFVVARMTFAVGSFALLWQLSGALIAEQGLSHMLRWPLAAISGSLIYSAWCLYSFRLDRQGLGILAGFHLFAWFVLWLFRAVVS